MRKHFIIALTCILILTFSLAGCGKNKPAEESSLPDRADDTSFQDESAAPVTVESLLLGNWYHLKSGGLLHYCFFPDKTCVISSENDSFEANTYTWALYEKTLRLTDQSGYSRLITIARINTKSMRWSEESDTLLLRTSPNDPAAEPEESSAEESSPEESMSPEDSSRPDESSREESKQEESVAPSFTEESFIGTWESNSQAGRSEITIRADHTGSMKIPLYWFPIDFDWSLDGTTAQIHTKSLLFSGTYALEILSFEGDRMTIRFNGSEMEATRIK